MLLSAIILWGTAAILAVVVMRRPGRRFPEALRHARANAIMVLPRIPIAIIAAGFLAELMPQQAISTWIGEGNDRSAGRENTGHGRDRNAAETAFRSQPAAHEITGQEDLAETANQEAGPNEGDDPQDELTIIAQRVEEHVAPLEHPHGDAADQRHPDKYEERCIEGAAAGELRWRHGGLSVGFVRRARRVVGTK